MCATCDLTQRVSAWLVSCEYARDCVRDCVRVASLCTITLVAAPHHLSLLATTSP